MTIDEAIEEKEKLILVWADELEMTPDNELLHLNHCKEIIENYKQEIEWLEELKGIKENNHNFFDKCMKENYNKAIDDFIKWAYLNGVDFSFMGKIKDDGISSDVPDRLEKIKNRFYTEHLKGEKNNN